MVGDLDAEYELEHLDRAVFAAEDWAKNYQKDPETFGQLIKAEARIARIMRRYFRELRDRVESFIDWQKYHQVNAAVTVDVLLKDGPVGLEDQIIFNVLYDEVAKTVGIGATAGERIYQKPLGLSQTSEVIQQKAKDIVANLVGKKYDEHGNLIDNPKSEYRISDQTRKDINESIRTSIGLSEDQQQAVERLRDTVNDPKRAELIARTEAVNAYQGGMHEMAIKSGAVAHEWQDLGASDECADNSDAGVIPIDEAFPSGDTDPPAHPNCRCGKRYVYKEELDGND